MNPRISIFLITIASITIVFPARVLAQEQSELKAVSRSATEFAVDLYHRISVQEKHTGKNLFFSPHSVYTVLALMYSGAAGQTAEQMATALHAQLEAERLQEGLASIQDILNQIS